MAIRLFFLIVHTYIVVSRSICFFSNDFIICILELASIRNNLFVCSIEFCKCVSLIVSNNNNNKKPAKINAVHGFYIYRLLFSALVPVLKNDIANNLLFECGQKKVNRICFVLYSICRKWFMQRCFAPISTWCVCVWVCSENE